MAGQWVSIPISSKLYLNLDEGALTTAHAALENAYVNEADGISRFPGLKTFVDLPDEGRVYLHDWRGDLMASTSLGQLYRVDRDGAVEDVTGVPISGGQRTTFAKTEDELVMAAGGPLIRFAGERTEILSDDAPESTHVAYVDSYLVAIEKDSGRFAHANAGDTRTWDALDTFAADGRPDNITSLIVTPFRELMLCGPDSIEQFERLPTGDVPFFRRWAVGEGVIGPHTITFADNALFAVNRRYEVVRISGQASQPVSDDLGRVLESVERNGGSWRDAWLGGYPDEPLNVSGQKWVLLQIPDAVTPYGTRGLTFAYDLRHQRWSSLYGWDAAQGMPTRWPGWSYWPLWGRMFVGAEGRILEFDLDGYSNAGSVQRWLVRTAYLSDLGEVAIDNLRVRMKRGTGSNTDEALIRIRCNRDNRGFGPWIEKGLGRAGQRHMTLEFGPFGMAHVWQFELAVSDDTEVELVKLEAEVRQVGH